MVAVPRTVPLRYMKVNVKARGPTSELAYTSRYGMVSERKAKDRFPVSCDPQGEETVDGKIYVIIGLAFFGWVLFQMFFGD